MSAGLHPRAAALVRALTDGRFRSGTELARVLGISRTAVWKHVERLAALGLEVHAVRGKGYRLARPLELLDAEAVRAAMPPPAAARLGTLVVHDVVDSTSEWLRRQPGDGPAACLAECQTAGRGRRGRRWVSPFGAHLYLSLRWRFETSPTALAGLSVATGVAVAEGLEACGADAVGLKWPNDLVHRGAKLGGILIDVAGEESGPARAVVGVGVNVRMPAGAAAELDQPWTELAALPGPPDCSRNRLAGRVLGALVGALERFAAEGLAPFVDGWARRDAVAGHEVEVQGAGWALRGRALGIDTGGALLLETGEGLRRVTAGEVSVRGWHEAAG